MTGLPSLRKDFDADFDALTQGLLPGYSGPPYAFARYADGEAAILRGESHRAKSDGWRVNGRSIPAIQSRLRGSLECELEGWRVGVTADSHHPQDHEFLLGMAGARDQDITFAEIFVFANWKRFKSLDLSACRFIGAGAESQGARGFAIPPDAVEQDGFDTSAAVDWMVAGSGPILLAAGPIAKIIAWDYWKATAGGGVRRDVCVDVGSAVSPMLRGRRTRRYHSQASSLNSLVPVWEVR